MEEEKGNVSQGSISIGVLECGGSSHETPVENFDRVEDGINGGEIMVEVVGSDVFVDSVKEGQFGVAEIRDLEDHIWGNREESDAHNTTESLDVSSERDENENENENSCIAIEDGGVGFSVSVCALAPAPARVVVSVDEVKNPGMDAMAALPSTVVENENVAKSIRVMVCEDKTIKIESVENDNGNTPVDEAVAGCLDLSTHCQQARVNEIASAEASFSPNANILSVQEKSSFVATADDADGLQDGAPDIDSLDLCFSDGPISYIDGDDIGKFEQIETNVSYQEGSEFEQLAYQQMPEISNFKVEKLNFMPKNGTSITEKALLLQGSNGNTAMDSCPKINKHISKRSVMISAKLFSANEMLLQLHHVAQDPKNCYEFHYNMRDFFEGFRASIALDGQGGVKMESPTVSGSHEESGLVSPHRTDKIVQNYSAMELLRDSKKVAGNHRFVMEEYTTPVHKSRKRFSNGLHLTPEIDENIKRRKQLLESSPAELIMNFAEKKYLPSEVNLNKMFRRFGSLVESKTEVDRNSGCAKVVFKRGSDAEVALNSSKEFNIFGPVLVHYRIDYLALISGKNLASEQ